MDNQRYNLDVADDLTVVVHRTIKPGQETGFEEAMKKFIHFALGFPGHLGINIIRPPEGDRDYVVVDKFADRNARDAFTASAEYREWMECLGSYTEGKPEIEEISGLEGWFNRPGQVLKTPPLYKTAVITFIGVCLVIALLNLVLSPLIVTWPYLVNLIVFNACVVALLTWVVMPVLTRLMSGWLFNPTGGRIASDNK